jgi:hypothetical protein
MTKMKHLIISFYILKFEHTIIQIFKNQQWIPILTETQWAQGPEHPLNPSSAPETLLEPGKVLQQK